MKRKLTALLLAVAALTALLGTMLAGSQIARAAVLELLDTSVADFNLGTLYHTELNYTDDGSVALQSIGLAGGWNDTTTTGLPPRIYHASTHIGSHIYVFGGSNGTDTLATSYVADILANHQLSSWRAVTPLPEPLSGSAAVQWAIRCTLSAASAETRSSPARASTAPPPTPPTAASPLGHRTLRAWRSASPASAPASSTGISWSSAAPATAGSTARALTIITRPRTARSAPGAAPSTCLAITPTASPATSSPAMITGSSSPRASPPAARPSPTSTAPR